MQNGTFHNTNINILTLHITDVVACRIKVPNYGKLEKFFAENFTEYNNGAVWRSNRVPGLYSGGQRFMSRTNYCTEVFMRFRPCRYSGFK
jgi:hypothetical protein